MTNKEKFLIEHNKLSPLSLQATLVLLTQFKEAKMSLFKNDNWSLDKLRRPFIIWLTSLSIVEKEKKGLKDKQLFHTYPREES